MAEKNPYPKGSARAKLWDRREADRKAKEGEKKDAPPKDEVEEEKERRAKLGYLRKNQTTDDNN